MIVFDTETTGFDKPGNAPLDKQPKIIEFAGIKVDDGTLEEIGRLEFLVDPQQVITEKIIEVTGITNEMLQDPAVLPFPAHFENLAEFFRGERTMAAHNVGFDRRMLEFDLRRIDKLTRFPWPIQHICTVEASINIKGHRLKLGVLHEHATGEKFGNAHRAMPDTEALLACVRWLRERDLL